MNSREAGQHAESLACRHLETQGLTLIQQNFFTPLGEIDLIMQDQDSLVFVEVRYRRHVDFGHPKPGIGVPKPRLGSQASAWGPEAVVP